MSETSEAVAPVSSDESLGSEDMPSGLSDLARETLAAMEADEAQAAPKAKTGTKKVPPKPEVNAGPPEGPDDDEEGEDGMLRAPPPPKRSYKAKANGKEYEVPEDRVQDELQRGYAARQKLEEVAQLRREIDSQRAELQAEIKRLKETPEEYLRGHEDVAERVLRERAEEWLKTQNMSPEARQEYQARREAEKKLQEYQAKEKQAQESESTRLFEEQKQVLEKQIGDAISKHKLPAKTTTIRVMAGIMRAAAARGVDLSMEDAAEATKQQLKAISDSSYGSMAPEDFVSNYPDLAEGIRKYYAKKASAPVREVGDVRTPNPNSQRKPNGQFAKPPPQEQWEKELEALKKKGMEERRAKGW